MSKTKYKFAIVECEVIDRGGHKMILAQMRDPTVYEGECEGGSAGQKVLKNHLAMRSHSKVNGKEPDSKAYRVIWIGQRPRGHKDWPKERMCW